MKISNIRVGDTVVCIKRCTESIIHGVDILEVGDRCDVLKISVYSMTVKDPDGDHFPSGDFLVRSPSGNKWYYPIDNFATLKEIRKQKLQKLNENR